MLEKTATQYETIHQFQEWLPAEGLRSDIYAKVESWNVRSDAKKERKMIVILNGERVGSIKF